MEVVVNVNPLWFGVSLDLVPNYTGPSGGVDNKEVGIALLYPLSAGFEGRPEFGISMVGVRRQQRLRVGGQ